MRRGKLKLAVLTGKDSPATCRAITMLARLPSVEIRGILVDTEPAPLKRRLRNLRRKVQREGWSFLYFRFTEFVRELLEGAAARLVPRNEVADLLRQSFPERASCLADLGQQLTISIQEVGNVNSREAAEALRRLDVDLGVVLGTRVLKRSTFSIPRMGCVNLHKGKVPAYRGLPPGFWELYDGQSSAGVTVHFVDDGLDTGDVLGEDCVPIHPKDSPETVRKKLDLRGSELLARCVQDLAEGGAQRRPQPPSNLKPRTSPTYRQRQQLYEKLGLPSRQVAFWAWVAKTLLYLAIFYSGLFHVMRTYRRITRTSRACTLLYHRVNDLAEDVLTTSVQRFAEHLMVLRRYYSVVPSSDLVAKVKSAQRVASNAVVIHFDDCYRDTYAQAAPMLAQVRFPACFFVSSGYLDTDRIFAHDAEKCPFRLENLRSQELVGLVAQGFEVGSHTVNHVDLGLCPDEVVTRELVQSKQALERILGQPVLLFSYPFGRKKNIRTGVVELVRNAGYEAMFSAYGGYVNGSSNLFDLPRVGISQYRPLDLLMEIEGLSLTAWKRRWARLWGRAG